VDLDEVRQPLPGGLVHGGGAGGCLVGDLLGLGAGAVHQGPGLLRGAADRPVRLGAGLGQDLVGLLARPGDHLLDLGNRGLLLAGQLVGGDLEQVGDQPLALRAGGGVPGQGSDPAREPLDLAERPARPLIDLAPVVALRHHAEALVRRGLHRRHGEEGGGGRVLDAHK
jgi:hypothetical protein